MKHMVSIFGQVRLRRVCHSVEQTMVFDRSAASANRFECNSAGRDVGGDLAADQSYMSMPIAEMDHSKL